MDQRPQWLQRAGAGISRGETVVCEYEGKHHALVKFPGHTFWQDRMSGQGYTPTEHLVIKKGASILRHIKLVEGRLTKAQKQDLINYVNMLDQSIDEAGREQP